MQLKNGQIYLSSCFLLSRRWVQCLCCILLFISAEAWATAQIPDRIEIEGGNEPLFSRPFDVYLTAPENLEKMRPFLEKSGMCSAAWGGYVAEWELKANRLYLHKIIVDPCSKEPVSVPLSVFFSNTQDPVFAEWFSGRLVIPRGQRTKYVHMGFESRYERYLLLQIERGMLTSQEVVKTLSKE